MGRAVRASRLAASLVPDGPHLVACSTDGQDIADVALAWGAGRIIERPRDLARDTASSVSVALHALDALAHEGRQFRAVVLVQPTSPLVEPADIAAAISRFDEGAPSVVSVTPSHPGSWHASLEGVAVRLADDRGSYVLTGACYVAAPDSLRHDGRFVVDGITVGQVVPPDRSVDIDDELDLTLAEGILAARAARPAPLGPLKIGDGNVLTIAEVGVNHNGDLALAHRLVDAVADSGADVVKFQTFDPAALAAPGAPTAEYQRALGQLDDQRAMLERLVLAPEAWAALQRHARERGLLFLSTPFDDASVELLDRLDVPAFKIGSGELTNLPFLERCARRGRTLVVSTGMADMVEVAAAVDAIRAAGDPPLVLLHCVSSYPADPVDANLRAIETMRRAFGVPVGWSDHTPGIELSLAAVAAGAAVVEKHVTLDRSLPGPDHRSSLEPAELRSMISAVRTVEAALGSGVKQPVDAERPIAAVARRSLHWRRDLEAGSVIGEEDLIALRPSIGISPARQATLIGCVARRPIAAGAPVHPDDVEPSP